MGTRDIYEHPRTAALVTSVHDLGVALYVWNDRGQDVHGASASMRNMGSASLLIIGRLDDLVSALKSQVRNELIAYDRASMELQRRRKENDPLSNRPRLPADEPRNDEGGGNGN